VSAKSVMGITATGWRRNRSWPKALKREIVAASFAPGSSVSMAARHYDVNANQVFNWRKRYRADPRVRAIAAVPQLIPVIVTAEQDRSPSSARDFRPSLSGARFQTVPLPRIDLAIVGTVAVNSPS
jgi:transposase